MKKNIATLLLVILLLISATASAATWTSIPAQTASPFAVEVIKLRANTDATGSKYYTILDSSTSYMQDTIYYAIKLSLPSYSDANAYYGTKDLVSGSKVKVTISYTNIANKDKEVAYAQLTDKAQTLWYDGENFVPAYLGKYVMSGIQINNTTAKITASVCGKGGLADIGIGNNYKVKKQEYYGVKPCANCTATNLSGYLVYSASSAYDVFFATANGKISGIYVVDRNQAVSYQGAKVLINEPLYQWKTSGQYHSTDGNDYYKYRMSELFYGESFNKMGTLNSPASSDGHFTKYYKDFDVSGELRDLNGVYYMDADGLYHHITGTESFWHTAPYYYKDSAASNGYLTYADTNALYYGNVYYGVDAYTSTAIHQMTSANSVNDDGADKAYLNSAYYVLNMLGLAFADVGNTYMSDDLWLQNFGFKADISSTADWGYSAQIVTLPIAEVPATGSRSMSIWFIAIIGVLMIVAYRLCKPKRQ